jgi:hypothetical protein
MNTIPAYFPKENFNYHPHVVILGAGASLAAFPKGDKFGRKLPLMNNIVEIVGLEHELQSLNITQSISDFEELYEDLNSRYQGNPHFESIKNKIYHYFKFLCLPKELTLYDKLILSLRENDLIATFNWDPFLGLAYQRNRHIKRLPKIAFLHGNVFIGICKEHKTMGFTNCACSKCGNVFEPVELLYPVKDKNYTNSEFINGEWELLKDTLNDAYMITIFGYSAPKTDVAAREIMHQVWANNKTRNFGEIKIIDIADKEIIKENWSEFFVQQHYGITDNFDNSYLAHYPRRSCEAFASASLFNDPWGSIDKYEGNSLPEFQEWISRLIGSEELHEKNKSFPLSRW